MGLLAHIRCSVLPSDTDDWFGLGRWFSTESIGIAGPGKAGATSANADFRTGCWSWGGAGGPEPRFHRCDRIKDFLKWGEREVHESCGIWA